MVKLKEYGNHAIFPKTRNMHEQGSVTTTRISFQRLKKKQHLP